MNEEEEEETGEEDEPAGALSKAKVNENEQMREKIKLLKTQMENLTVSKKVGVD